MRDVSDLDERIKTLICARQSGCYDVFEPSPLKETDGGCHASEDGRGADVRLRRRHIWVKLQNRAACQTLLAGGEAVVSLLRDWFCQPFEVFKTRPACL